MPLPANLSGLSRAELEAWLVELLGDVAELKRIVAVQGDEIARLKGNPCIKPSGMQNATEPTPGGKRSQRRGRGKMTPRVTPETEVLWVAVPQKSQFKGYELYQVQDLVLNARVVCYRRERWLTPEGETIVAPLPSGIRGHFGPELRRFVLMQHRQGQVTVERLVTLLQAIGVSLSKRQRQNPQRYRPRLSRRLPQARQDLPQARHHLLGLPGYQARCLQRRRCAAPSRPHSPPPSARLTPRRPGSCPVTRWTL